MPSRPFVEWTISFATELPEIYAPPTLYDSSDVTSDLRNSTESLLSGKLREAGHARKPVNPIGINLSWWLDLGRFAGSPIGTVVARSAEFVESGISGRISACNGAERRKDSANVNEHLIL